MSTPREKRPVVATVIGDPAGIGPEVIAKAWATGRVHDCSLPVLVGSVAAMERAVEITGVAAKVRAVSSVDEISDDPAVLDILDSGALDGQSLALGEDSPVSGAAVCAWLDEARALVRSGSASAWVMGPVSSGSIKMAGMRPNIVSPTPGESYLVLFSGPLRIAHVTDHVPLSQVGAMLTPDLVADALHKLNDAMKAWGLSRQRIGVAGFNPHAQGEEDQNAIAPGVRKAKAAGVDVEGPISPDSVFRHCIEGRYDMVLAMYHDQGHIAMKTWGFSGNSVVVLGAPELVVTVAHGTAYDIVGQNIADPAMIQSAMRMAGYLSAGRGFPED